LMFKSTGVSCVTGPPVTLLPSTVNTLRGIAFSCDGILFRAVYCLSMKFSEAPQSIIDVVVVCSLLFIPRIVALIIIFSCLS